MHFEFPFLSSSIFLIHFIEFSFQKKEEFSVHSCLMFVKLKSRHAASTIQTRLTFKVFRQVECFQNRKYFPRLTRVMIKYTSDFKKGFTKMKVPRQGRSDAEPENVYF